MTIFTMSTDGDRPAIVGSVPAAGLDVSIYLDGDAYMADFDDAELRGGGVSEAATAREILDVAHSVLTEASAAKGLVPGIMWVVRLPDGSNIMRIDADFEERVRELLTPVAPGLRV